jgi:hypothetical protein
MAENRLRQRTLRAARLTRQTGKRVAGVTAGQVTDLPPHRAGVRGGDPGLAGSLQPDPERRFPAPSSGSQSGPFSARNRRKDRVVQEWPPPRAALGQLADRVRGRDYFVAGCDFISS